MRRVLLSGLQEKSWIFSLGHKHEQLLHEHVSLGKGKQK